MPDISSSCRAPYFLDFFSVDKIFIPLVGMALQANAPVRLCREDGFGHFAMLTRWAVAGLAPDPLQLERNVAQ